VARRSSAEEGAHLLTRLASKKRIDLPFSKEVINVLDFHPVGSDLTMTEAKRSRINAFGIEYEGKMGLLTSEFSWAA
jgi:hypothetical protein